MSAARNLTPPMSGRDRKHFNRELAKGKSAHEKLLKERDAAYVEAHRLDCDVWTVRQFLGGPEDPSPTIEQALHGGRPLLEVTCRNCHHSQIVDLADVVWPRSNPVHTMRHAFYCSACYDNSAGSFISRPELVALHPRQPKPSEE